MERVGARLWGGLDRTSEMALGSGWAGASFELSGRAARAGGAPSRRARSRRGAPFGAVDARRPQESAGVDDALFAALLGATAPHPAPASSLLERRARLLAELLELARRAGREAA